MIVFFHEVSHYVDNIKFCSILHLTFKYVIDSSDYFMNLHCYLESNKRKHLIS